MAMDSQFQPIIEYLMEAMKKVAEASRANGDRPWVNFGPVAKVGKFEFERLHDELFTRSDSNDNYAQLKTDSEAKMKDVQTAKLSADFLAGCERDYRMRTRSRVRMLVHAEVVSAGAYGADTGPLRRNTLDWLGRIDAEVDET